MKEVRDTPVQINKGDVKDLLDFGQICLLFCFDFFFLRRRPQIQLLNCQGLIPREPG